MHQVQALVQAEFRAAPDAAAAVQQIELLEIRALDVDGIGGCCVIVRAAGDGAVFGYEHLPGDRVDDHLRGLTYSVHSAPRDLMRMIDDLLGTIRQKMDTPDRIRIGDPRITSRANEDKRILHWNHRPG